MFIIIIITGGSHSISQFTWSKVCRYLALYLCSSQTSHNVTVPERLVFVLQLISILQLQMNKQTNTQYVIMLQPEETTCTDCIDYDPFICRKRHTSNSGDGADDRRMLK